MLARISKAVRKKNRASVEKLNIEFFSNAYRKFLYQERLKERICENIKHRSDIQ
jgi:hypothetical protein